MAASTFGALKAYLEAQGLGIAVYKDAPPTGVKDATSNLLKAPYCVVTPDLGMVRDKHGDAATTGTELVQLDLWQNWHDPADKVSESATLPDAITVALEGTRLMQTGTGVPPKAVYSVRQLGRIRQLNRDANLVRHIYTLGVHRSIV